MRPRLRDDDAAHLLREAARFRVREAGVSVDEPTAARRYGNAVLTRHAMLVQHFRPLQPADDCRTVVHVGVAFGARTLDIYATHLNHEAGGASIRAQQAADLLDYVKATSNGGPSIVMGDFNTPADAPELGVIAAHYREACDSIHQDAAQDAPEHSTLNPVFNPLLRIDHVLFDARLLGTCEAPFRPRRRTGSLGIGSLRRAGHPAFRRTGCRVTQDRTQPPR